MKRFRRVLLVLINFLLMMSFVACSEDNEVTVLTVSFDSQSATIPADPANISITADGWGSGTLMALPDAPVKTGFAFGGWFTAVDGGTAFTVYTVFAADITVYAKWIDVFTVSYVSQSADTPASPTNANVLDGKTVTALPSVPLRTGYTFGGWTNNSGVVFDATTDVFADITVYVKWLEVYTVTYNGNGNISGAVPTDSSGYTDGQQVIVLGNSGSLVKTNSDGISLSFGWNTQADGDGTDYVLASSTFTMGSTNITLYAKWSVLRATGPAGGLIFYDKGSYSAGWRYLEAAPLSTETSKAWGSYEANTYATNTAIGSGQTNTTAIVTWLSTNSEAYRATQRCDDLVYGGFSDWFLPSKDELNEICWVLHSRRWTGTGREDNPVYGTNRVGGFTDGHYWSSSEYNTDIAWGQDFFDGYQSGGSKYFTDRVRAVRAF